MSPSPSTKPLLRALAGETVCPVPFWFMRQAGRYLPEYRELRARRASFLELCYEPELAVEASLQPLRRFGPDGVILFSDILVVLDALGVSVDFRAGEGPVVEPVRSADDLAAFDAESFHARLAPVYETLHRLAREIPPEVALIGFAGAPWTLASYLVEGGTSRDFARIKRWAFADRDGFAALIDRLTEAVSHFLLRQIEAGAETVQIFDSWAGVLPAGEFTRWCVEPMARIVSAIRQRAPKTPIIAFPRGVGPLYAHLVVETGIDAVGIDSALPLHWARDVLQGSVTLQGNLDPQLVVVGGEPMLSAAGHILDTLGHGPFVFNLGHGVVPDTPPANVERLARAIRAWRA